MAITMSNSQALVDPFFVQFNSTATEEDETNLAFPFLVIHIDDEEHYTGWVFAHDERNAAGLTDGLNWREQIGKGSPGVNVSWSEIPPQTGDV
jgi:hypothetical protein